MCLLHWDHLSPATAGVDLLAELEAAVVVQVKLVLAAVVVAAQRLLAVVESSDFGSSPNGKNSTY